jgi:hypothetical protein
MELMVANGQIEIETGIPLPLGRKYGPVSKYPWAQLEVGESFFVADPPSHFATMVSHASRIHSRKFIQRQVDGGIRVWRVA